jgi:hypothetical protein
MKLGFEVILKSLVEYTLATESSRMDGGDNDARGCLLSACSYFLFRPRVTYQPEQSTCRPRILSLSFHYQYLCEQSG